MRSINWKYLLLAAMAAATLSATGQPLTCQSGAGAEPVGCKVSHYHVRMYRPDTKFMVELTGVNEFATKSACDAALAAERARNTAVVEFMKKNEPRAQYQADIFGTCHCDLTRSRSSSNFLDEPQRLMQLRTQQDVLGKVRLRLIDANALPNSDLVRSLRQAPFAFDPALWPKALITPDPKSLDLPPLPVAEAQTRPTSVASDTPAGAAQTIDFPLVDVPTPKDAMVTVAVAPSGLSGDGSTETATDSATPPPPSGEANAATEFVNFETARVQAILKAAGQVDDAALKKNILEASILRLQVLSNITLIVETAGSRSKLAAAFRAADDETARVDLAVKLFGEQIRAHWAVSDARDVVVEIPAELTGDPVAVLNESTGKYTPEQKKSALYYMLGRSSNLTSGQLLRLSELMQSFL